MFPDSLTDEFACIYDPADSCGLEQAMQQVRSVDAQRASVAIARTVRDRSPRQVAQLLREVLLEIAG